MRYWIAGSLLAVCFGAGVWDVVAIAKGSRETVSSVLHEWSLLYPVLPLAVGLLLGHIFWPNSPVTIIRD